WMGVSLTGGGGNNTIFRYFDGSIGMFPQQRALLSIEHPVFATNVFNHYIWVMSSNRQESAWYLNGKRTDTFPWSLFGPEPNPATHTKYGCFPRPHYRTRRCAPAPVGNKF